jgi:hypothetical protein
MYDKRFRKAVLYPLSYEALGKGTERVTRPPRRSVRATSVQHALRVVGN